MLFCLKPTICLIKFLHDHHLLELSQISNFNDKKVLCVWGIVWGMDIDSIIIDCSTTALILILQYKNGGGGRI